MKRASTTAVIVALTCASGCTSSEFALDPSALQPPPSSRTATPLDQAIQPPPAQPAPTAGGQTAAAPAAVPAGTARIRFEPVVGATEAATSPLAARLSARAAQRGISLAGSGDSGPALLMKGYFSSFTEGPETTVIYVWDVLDQTGNRLHRIQGQQKAAGQGDGWSAVTAPTMEAIADRTIDDLAAWLTSRQG